MRSSSARRSRVAIALVVLIAAVAMPSRVYAEDTLAAPPVAVTPNPLVLKDGAATATLKNLTGIDVPVTASVVDKSGNPVEVGFPDVTGDASATLTLPPGGTVLLELRPESDTELTLVVTVPPVPDGWPTGAVVRTPVGAAKNKALPAVTEWQATHRLWATPPWGRTDVLPLTDQCAALKLPDSGEVGTLQGDGRSLRVKASCATPEDHTVQLTFGDVPWLPTTYKGTIDLIEGSDTGKVAVTVVSTSVWWLPLGLLFVGGLLAVGLECLRRVVRPEMDARATLKEVRNRVTGQEPIDRKFKSRAKELGLEDLETWEIAKIVTDRTDELESKLNDRKKRDGSQLPAIAEETTQLDDLLSAWVGVPDKVAALRGSLSRLEAIPLIEDSIKESTGVCPTSTDEMSAYVKAVAEDTAFTLGWPTDSLRYLKRYSACTADLFMHLETIGSRTQAEERVSVRDLAPYFKKIADPACAPTTPKVAPFGVTSLPEPRTKRGYLRLDLPPDAKAARRIRVRATWFDILITVAAVAVALVAGFTVLRGAGPFAGPWSVVLAISWGLTSGTVGGQVMDAVVQARGSTARLRT